MMDIVKMGKIGFLPVDQLPDIPPGFKGIDDLGRRRDHLKRSGFSRIGNRFHKIPVPGRRPVSGIFHGKKDNRIPPVLKEFGFIKKNPLASPLQEEKLIGQKDFHDGFAPGMSLGGTINRTRPISYIPLIN